MCSCICFFVNAYHIFIYLFIYWKSLRGTIPLTNIWRELDVKILLELLKCQIKIKQLKKETE